jgi:hypothetical protein
MASWLKLVGTIDWPVREHWVMERSDLLEKIRFGDAHPPIPIRRGDQLVYHAVLHRRLIGIVEVRSDEPRYEPEPDWERRWPWVLDVVPILKVGRVSQGPSTSLLDLTDDFAHQSFLPLTTNQYDRAVRLLRVVGAR